MLQSEIVENGRYPPDGPSPFRVVVRAERETTFDSLWIDFYVSFECPAAVAAGI
jgi:hypothetical protein